MHVFITGDNYVSLLGMARALGLANYDITIIHVGPMPSKLLYNKFLMERSIEKSSKYVGRYFWIRPEKKLLQETLLSLKPDFGDKGIIIPTDDFSASAIDENLGELFDSFHIPHIHQRPGAVEALMNKYRQKALADGAGLQTARGWVVEKSNKAYRIPADISFPCIIKPLVSYTGKKNLIQKINSRYELQSELNRIASSSNCELLIEEYIPFEKEYAVVGVCGEDHVFIPFLFEMLQGGSGLHKGVTLRGSVQPLDQSSELALGLERFMKSTGFTGLFDIDLYERDGIIYFNELNLRFGASGFAATAMGINLPAMFTLLVSGNPDFSIYLEENQKKLESCDKRFFISEKVALEEYVESYISRTEYYRLLREADICMIKAMPGVTDGDDEPYRLFLRNSRLSVIKRLIKSLI